MAINQGQHARYRPLHVVLAVVFAATTVVYSVAWMYYTSLGGAPVEVGMDTKQVATGLRVPSVYDDSPAQEAGLRVGDIILTLDGQSVASPHDGITMLDRLWLRSRPGDTVHFTVQRAGEAAPMSISAVFRRPAGSGDRSLARRGASHVMLLYPLLFLVVGLAVLFLRLEDRNAWLLALMFAGFIAVPSTPFACLIAPEGLRQFLNGYNALLSGLVAGLFYFFFAVFPTRSPMDRKLPWLKWVLLIIGVSLRWGNFGEGGAEALPFLTHFFSRQTLDLTRTITGWGSVPLGIVSLLSNLISVPRVEERRKLKVMLWGTVVGVIPALAISLPFDLSHRDKPFWLTFTEVVFLFVFPASFAYAVIKHRVMDIPVLLRRSARYLLVERGFAILMLLISVGITLWFGQAFSQRFSAGSKAAIPVGATLGVLLISGATQVHRRVRTRLDQAFFRSAYDAQQVLEDLAAKTLMVTSRDDLAVLLHEHIQKALHPMPLVVYLLTHDGYLRAYAGDPPQEASLLSAKASRLEPLRGRSEPVTLDPARLRGTPLEPLGAECLLPIRGSSDEQLQGLVALGPRLSEEPYSARDKRLLASVGSQAGIAMRSISLAEEMAERMEAERRSEQEMQIARRVQSRLLPQKAPVLTSLECAGKCIQTRAVGGDYYDFLDFGSGKLGLVLADISGKGISGALLMANLQANLRSQYALALGDIPQLLRSVNHLFYKNTETNNYATTFFAIYDDGSRGLRYVNCGHNPPLLLRGNGEVEWLQATATVLGLFEQWDCSVAERQMSPGDVLLIYTDGISEAAAGENAEEFGEERLVQGVRTNRLKPAAEMLEAIVAEVQRFSHGEQADDMTLIVSRCR